MSSSEDKAEKFRRISEKRVNGVLEKLRLLGKCANRQYYEYSQGQIKKMFKVIDDEWKYVKSFYSNPSESEFRWEE